MDIAIYCVAGFVIVGSLNILSRMGKAAKSYPLEDYLTWTIAIVGSAIAIYRVSWWPCGGALILGFIVALIRAFRKLALRQISDPGDVDR